MADTKWTVEQLRAITEKNCNMLVSAAAGAGKTAVLVERIIRTITDPENPVDIDRLLIVTFTNAAATEMRERIGNAIVKIINENEDTDNLRRQLTLLNKANITTIHSFCLDVVKNNFHKIDLDPVFRIADETEAILMKMEVLEQLFEDKYENDNNSDFLKLVECYGGKLDDRRLMEMVLNLYEFVQSCPWPKEWLKENTRAFNLDKNLDFGSTKWAKNLKNNLKTELEGMKNALQRSVNICMKYGLDAYLSSIRNDMDLVAGLHKSLNGSWDEIRRAFSGLEFKKLSPCAKDTDKNARETVKSIRTQVKDRLRKLEGEIFNSSSEEIIGTLKTIYPSVECLTKLVIDFETRYSERKREKSIVDFNDLEHFCLSILTERDKNGDVTPSDTALDYRNNYEELLIDEYQDSNSVQEVILNIISGKAGSKPNIFMVGDVKQSIYRFRQAKPELFLQKYNTYSAKSDSIRRKIILSKNFRSRREILDGVNFIFKQIMTENIGELNYNDKESLYPGREYKDDISGSLYSNAVEIHIGSISEINENESDTEITDSYNNYDNGDKMQNIPDAIQAEAKMVCQRIKTLVSGEKPFNVWDSDLDKYRPVRYSDIVILLRTTKNRSDVFTEELISNDIPAFTDTGTGFFRTVEIETIMSLLKIIDNPLQDIPMLAVLRSPAASFSADELAVIRQVDKNSVFYETMVKMSKEYDTALAQKVKNFLSRLETWRKKALHMDTDELIRYLYNETGFYNYTALMPGGVQRQANLRILCERARQYEETSYRGLFNFINFIDRLKSRKGDMGSAKILGENENVVRIMSIHKSKGLEFPVVFVSGCGKRFNLTDARKSMLLHEELGIGLDFTDPEKRITYPTAVKHALAGRIKLETLSEEMRILYVAFTRAQEKLIITGMVKDIEKESSKWLNSTGTGEYKIPEYEISRGHTYLDWICAAVARHKDLTGLQNISDMKVVPPALTDNSKWIFTSYNINDLDVSSENSENSRENIKEKLLKLKDAKPFTKYAKIINSRLSWKYSFSNSANLPVKVTVTELKRRLNTGLDDGQSGNLIYSPPLVKRPRFLEKDQELTAAEKGTVLHFVMQHLDLNHVSNPEEITVQLDKMADKDLLTREEIHTVDVQKILKFFNSDIGVRMLSSGVVKREAPFNLEIDSSEIDQALGDNIHTSETILLQGIIDCYFEEPEGLALLDYKTDYVPSGKTDRLRSKYHIQIQCYKRALKKLTGKKVTTQCIYLFHNGETIYY